MIPNLKGTYCILFIILLLLTETYSILKFFNFKLMSCNSYILFAIILPFYDPIPSILLEVLTQYQFDIKFESRTFKTV